MTGPLYRRSSQLLEAEVGDELVGMDVDRGDYFGFNQVAATVWRKLESPMDFENLLDVLIQEYDVNPEECATELQGLLDDLIDKGLVAADAG